MTFTSPIGLLLLLLLPLFAWIGWPTRGPSQKRETIALLLRLSLALCLILSLAGLELPRGGDELAVVFLVDVSDSMSDEAINAATRYVKTALAASGPDDQSAIILFGGDALVERPMLPGNDLGQITSVPVTTQTDLAQAIRLGLALFPSGAARRMVILSDGAQTNGDALKAAEFAKAIHVQIISVPFITQPGAEALISAVEAPSHLRPGENFHLNVSVQSNQPIRATLRVLSGDTILYEQPHDLRRGQQTFSLPLRAGETGFTSYEVQITPEQDTFYQNNRIDAFSQIDGLPRLLLVGPTPGENLPGGATRPDEYSTLLAALQAANYSIDLVAPKRLPTDLAGLAQYNAVILVDVPARELSNRQMETLQNYVRNLGGGLLTIGGPTSFGVGGYYDTPLEAALPLEMQIKDEQRRPSLAIVFIIDHSGSMSETSGGVEKLELAKEAVARSVELLFPTDRVGVIAFDDTAAWVVPMTDLADILTIQQAIGSIQSGGGTDILAGVQAMANVLPNDPAKVKHVILLTDGGADPTGIAELVEKLSTESGITLSTVAIGRDAAPFLQELADTGAGRYHFTTDAGSIPSIFTEETSLATRAYIEEGAFFPKLVNSSPILIGIETLPRLYGYVATSPKPLAQVILKSEKDDPLLAAWQYGLGRSVAFTSDATGRWGSDWVNWENYATFWAQAVRYTLGETSAAALQLSVVTENEQARFTLDARAPGGDFLNGYQITANVVGPNGKTQAVTLRQVAPGRYEANFTSTTPGIYLLRLAGQPGQEGGAGFVETTGWILSYSPEYRAIEPNPDLLVRLAALTDGKVASADPREAFSHDLKAARATRAVWPWLLALAAILLPLDVAARRLIVTRHDFAAWRAALFARLIFGKKTAVLPESNSQMGSLFQAKERAHRSSLQAEAGTAVSPAPVETAVAEKPGSAESGSISSSEMPAETSTAAALLARKKNLRGKNQ